MPPLGVTPYNQLPPYMMANPMYQAQQFQPYNAFSGVQTGNPLMNLGVQLAGPVLANAFGGTAMGMNGMPGGNLYNNIRMQNFSRNHIAMINRLGAANTQPFIDNVGGLSALADLDLFSNPDYASTIGKAASFAGGNSLTVDSFGSAFGVNNLMDKLTGGRNIAGLASGISMAGRNRYDPRTGRLGMSAGSAGAMAEDLYEELGYARGPNAWRRNTDGFGAGAMGDLFGEMSTRGMLSPESSASAPGAGPDWRKFGAGPKSGSVDTNKVKSQLQDMTKALSAVREIFGDAGITNAPMGQLMSALENITQGGVYQIDKEKVGLQLRTMREAANAANIGMGGAFQMMMAGNRYADQLGLVPTGAWTIPATTEAINFGLGLEASGAIWDTYTAPRELKTISEQKSTAHLVQNGSHFDNILGAFWLIVALRGFSYETSS